METYIEHMNYNPAKIDAGVYVSTLCLYKMTQEPYKDCEVGDKYFLSVTHYASSMNDADRKAKVYFAKDIFSDEDVLIFGCHSVKVTCQFIDTVMESVKRKAVSEEKEQSKPDSSPTNH